MAIIYHITTGEAWENARCTGYYSAPSLKIEGFIHCCEERQVEGVLKRYYPGCKDLVKLHIDTEKLIPLLRYEMASSIRESFPHIYGPIHTGAVIKIDRL